MSESGEELDARLACPACAGGADPADVPLGALCADCQRGDVRSPDCDECNSGLRELFPHTCGERPCDWCGAMTRGPVRELWIGHMEGHKMGALMAVGRSEADVTRLITRAYRRSIGESKGDYWDPAQAMGYPLVLAEQRLDEYYGIRTWTQPIDSAWDVEFGRRLV